MNKRYLLFIILLISFNTKGQTNYGPVITAMGNAGVAIQNVWSAQKNQAGLASLKNPQIAIAYENKFGLRELSTQSAVFAIPFKSYAIGTNFQSYGIDSYKETKSGLGLAKSFGPKLLMAIYLNYHQINIENYGNAQNISVDVGLQFEAFPNLWLATHVANPTQSKYGINKEQIIPAHIQFGASYKFSDQLLISTEIEKILDAQVDFKTGIEYKIVEFIALRGGISANPFKQYAGFGLYYKAVNLDFAVASHPVIGYSPQISLGYEF